MSPPLVRAILLSPLALCATLALAQSRNYSEGGYANRRSVANGETISFHIATSRSPFDVEIVNLASPYTVLEKITGLVSQTRDCSGKWERGCGWPVTAQYRIPSWYTPGYYAARFRTSEGERHILFVVRPPVPGSYAPIAVIQPTNSDLAYNRFGGKSVYDTISDDGKRAHIVSFDRPYYDDEGLARFRIWEERFVYWMKEERRRFEVITDEDMEMGFPLSAYEAVLIVGHSEYWSLKARRHLEQYSRNGGHIAIFGANTMWWQVRMDLQSRQMTVYKDAALDPLTGVDNDLVTTNFSDWPVLNPENRILGASFLNAAYANRANSHDRLPLEERTPYTVRDAHHWIFAGTNVRNGDQIARWVGATEVDGALFNTLPNGTVVVEGSDGTPLTYQVLATLPASDGYATIGMYVNENGGAVFNGAARDWTYGLSNADEVVRQMTRNVLDRFASGEPFQYAPRRTPNRAEERFNHPPTTTDFLPGWRYHRFGFAITPQCAREGPTGLLLAGPRWTQVVRNLAFGRQGVSKAAASLWIDASRLQSTPSFATPLLAFIDYRARASAYVAALEVMVRPEGPALRVSSFHDGATVARTDWVVLAKRWQSVQFSWQSPGLLELNVAGKKVSAFNPQSDQRMNALQLEFAGSSSTGSVCVDHLQLRDAFAPASPATSTVTASRRTLDAGSSSDAEIVVELRDESGHALVTGGDAVTLSTTLGTLSSVTDLGDGTYRATLRPSRASGTALIRAIVNGQQIADTATVAFTPSDGTGTPKRRATRR